MSAYLKKVITVLILGYLTFLATLNTLHGVILWAIDGGDYIFEPYLLGTITGGMPVATYFCASAAAAFIFLTLTTVVAYWKPPRDSALARAFFKMEENMMVNRYNLEEQGKTIQSIYEELFPILESISNIKKETSTESERQRRAILNAGKLNAKTIEKEMSKLNDIKTRLRNIEKQITPLQPKITSSDKPQKINGIGPRIGDALRAMGITSVGELITTDPTIIAVKTRLSLETVKQLRAAAQLQMIPGVDENDVELLRDVDVFTIKELAGQDPIQLGRRIAEIAETYVEQGKIDESEKPSLEEVMSWVKLAHPLKKSCLG
jgi:predicted flap endonuclease-1-like 5' DNA nuclease